MSKIKKVLIIRFSSIGDIAQSLCLVVPLKEAGFEPHFLTKEEMAKLVRSHPSIAHTWLLSRGSGFLGLVRLAIRLRRERFELLVDAHNNLRSYLLCFLLRWPLGFASLISPPSQLVRSHQRFRKFLALKLKLKTLPTPYIAQLEYLKILQPLGIKTELPRAPQIFPRSDSIEGLDLPSHFVALGPSANHDLKRWPLDYWKALIRNFPQENFVVLGGREDAYLAALSEAFPERTIDLVGKTDLEQTGAILQRAKATVSNDTGILHIADQLGRPAIGLQGPTAFGYAARPSSRNLSLNLDCQPCSKFGKGSCRNQIFKRCLTELSPERVSTELKLLLNQATE